MTFLFIKTCSQKKHIKKIKKIKKTVKSYATSDFIAKSSL